MRRLKVRRFIFGREIKKTKKTCSGVLVVFQDGGAGRSATQLVPLPVYVRNVRKFSEVRETGANSQCLAEEPRQGEPGEAYPLVQPKQSRESEFVLWILVAAITVIALVYVLK